MSKDSPKTFHVKSYGCQMNVYDGERMAEMFTEQGMTAVDDKDQADLVILNTCHIREKAAEKVYSEIGRLKKDAESRNRKGPMVAVAGCVAQAEGAEITRRAPSVDIVVGPQAYHHLPDMIGRAASGKKTVDLDLPGLEKFGHLPAKRKSGPTAFLTVQEGCDKFCTYCVVPYTRGAEISRGWSALIDEAKMLVEGGAKEITLLGQNVNAWSGEDDKGRMQGLDGLIRALDRIDGLQRIRYTTSHPNDMTDGLIQAHGDIEKLMPYLHLPVQAGSDRILKAMNRSHDRKSYIGILEKVRRIRPDIAISGDFIVGFPGESDADFAETMSLVSEVGYATAYSFKYSARPGTPAAGMEGQIAPEIMDERLQSLQSLLGQQQLDFNNATIGKQCDILLERNGKYPGQLIGKSPWLQSTHIDATGLAIGDMVRVHVSRGGHSSIAGDVIMQAAA